MRKIRYSILHDRIRQVYVPQYSYDGISWCSFERTKGLGGTIVFSSLSHAKRFIKKEKK